MPRHITPRPASSPGDLDSLLAVEERLERDVRAARDEAARVVAIARDDAERADRLAADEAARHRTQLRVDIDARAREQIDVLERDGARTLARYRAVDGERLESIADELCALLVAAVTAGDEP